MALSPDQMREAVVRNLAKRTGKSLEQWIAVARRSPSKDPKLLREWLKKKHGLGGTTCGIIARATLGTREQPVSDFQLLAHQFKGERAGLRPVYDRLVRQIKGLGPDVRVGVRKTQTTFARKYTFAIAKAPTRSRIDLGLRLPGARGTKRLRVTRAFSDNATHCVTLTDSSDVDLQLKKWLEAAYDARG